jgi:DNA repair exonuclease SbcCD nuclease subunit
MEHALAPAMRGEVDLVVHAGDLFDRSKPPAMAVRRGAELIRDLARRVPVVVMPGNHDRRGLKRYIPHRLPGLHVVDEATRLVVAGVALAVVPFHRQAEAWKLAAEQAVAGGVDLLVAHQAFHGARVPGLTFRVGAQGDTIGEQHLPDGVRHVMCGHIHPRQCTRVGGVAVVQPGSTERTSMSERDQTKGTVVWELGRKVTWRFADGKNRRMLRVTGPADLDAVEPGTLVGVPRELREALRTDVLARGGWLWGPPMRHLRQRPQEPAVDRQTSLF